MDHATILTTLLGLARKKSVHLVARDVIPGTHVSPGKAWFFLPDLHLLSSASAAAYAYSFGTNPNGPTNREPLLFELCERLEPLVQSGNLFVVQLGDLADLYRERQIAQDQDLAATLRSVLDDNPAASTFLADSARLKASLVLGNHDHVGALSWQSVPATRRMRRGFALPPDGHVVVTHGDAFDPIEDIPDPFAKWGVQFAPGVGPSERSLAHALELDALTGIPARHGVANAHPLLPRATSFADAVRQGKSGILTKLGLDDAMPVRLFVIGHTHLPRIVRHGSVVQEHVQRPAIDLMDCGAWLERSRLPNDELVPSCHVGVIAESQTGVDARVYQLTPA